MKSEHMIAVALVIFLASSAASAAEPAVNETELFIIGFDIAEGSSEEDNLKDMAEQMGGSYISAEDASTASDLEVALTRSFAGIHGGVTEKVPLLETRCVVATVEDGAVYSWGPQEFAGFYYDIDDNIGQESITLCITGDDLEEPNGVVYETVAQQDTFDFEEWGEFWTIAFLAEEYFAAYVEDSFLYDDSTDDNLMVDEQLSKVLINDDEERTFATGTPLKLEEGYELVIQEINVDNNWVYVQLMKNGIVVDTDVIEPSKIGATIEDKTYTYKMNLGDTKDIVVIAVHFKNAIHLTSSDKDLATVDGIWQISDTYTDVEEDTEYDKMTIQVVNADTLTIMMNNEDNKITLNKNKDTLLMGDIRIKTANDKWISAENPLRFYLYKEITEPGTYEIRGSVKDVFDGTVEWDVSSFAGFYYDIDYDLGNEEIVMTITGDYLDEPNGIVYETTAQLDTFDFEEWGEFWTLAFLAEEHFAAYFWDSFFYGDSTDDNLMIDEQLSKVLINDDEERTFATGTPLKLKEGYELVIQEINVDNNWVYVQLMKNGMVVDTDVIEPSKIGATIEDKTYTYKMNLGDTKDIVVIAVHFKNAIHLTSSDQDLATVDGIWQISDTYTDVEEDTEYDKMTIQVVNAEMLTIMMDNEDERIILSKDKDILLMGDIRIKTANDKWISAENPNRFYIYKMVTVEPQESKDEGPMNLTNSIGAFG